MKVVDEAKKWVGYLEKKSNANLDDFTKNAGSGNYTYFSKWYADKGYGNYQAQPWCAIFVSYVLGHAYENSEEFAPHFHYCPTAVNTLKAMGVWNVGDPQKGDIIFFRDGEGTACHVGIVEDVDLNRVYTIEGNTSSVAGVVANGGCVAKKTYLRTYTRIMGYARPNYPKDVAPVRELETINDIVWELAARGIANDVALWMNKLETDANAYWLARKTVHYMRTHGV